MARLARVAAPGLPHHVTQRGNRRQQFFLGLGDDPPRLSSVKEWPAMTGRVEASQYGVPRLVEIEDIL